MSATTLSLSPRDAWSPLPGTAWNEAAARHLLCRVGFSAPSAELKRALREGPEETLRRYFARMPEFPAPDSVTSLQEDTLAIGRNLAETNDPAQRRRLQRDARERSRVALQDMTLDWLQLAASPANSAAEKWLLFLSDVWVVSVDKVKNTALIHQHQDILRRHALGPAPALAKAMARSPAMIVYLDLQQSRRGVPNENFARELFELFLLGEGSYTEADIKEAARAFTGYRHRGGEFLFARRQHDDGRKIVFGQSGRHDGDDVIDLAFKRPAAATFLPREMTRFYLSDVPLPPDYTDALGERWAAAGFNLRELAVSFFSSRVFYAPEFRGNFIKSPVQFYLGLLQDLDLRVAPLPRFVLGALKQMGQLPFNPPNVRGWVGGQNWINSATLAVRRQVVQSLLQPPEPRLLNADEVATLRRAGDTGFALEAAKLEAWSRLPTAQAARTLLSLVRPAGGDVAAERAVSSFLADNPQDVARIRSALAALLESPAYQLC